MDYEYLWSEDEIYKGNQAIIVRLLRDIEKAYRDEIDYNMRNRSSNFIL